MSGKSIDKRRPVSGELIDLHVSVVPPEYWNQKLNHASQRVIEETFSAGFIRVHPGRSIASLRQVISDQIGDHLFSTKYVFLKHVGRCLAMVNEKQEIQLRAKNFIPPQNISSEIFILPILPATYNQSKLALLDGKSQSRSEDNSKYFDENSLNSRFPTSREISQRSQLTPVLQSNSTEPWHHELPDRTMERFVSGKSAAGKNDALQNDRDSSNQEQMLSQHSSQQQSSGFVSPKRQLEMNEPDSHLSFNESTVSDNPETSRRSNRRTVDNFQPLTGEVTETKHQQHSSQNSYKFNFNPTPNHENLPSQIQQSQFFEGSSGNQSNNDRVRQAKFDEKSKNHDPVHNNKQMTYVVDTNSSQPLLQSREKHSLNSPSARVQKSEIGDEMSPVSYTEHTPQSDIQHVQYVKKNNDSGFIENPNDFEDDNLLEMRRSKLSSHQKQSRVSQHTTPQIVEEHEEPSTRSNDHTKMSYRQTLEVASPYTKERNDTPEWGENTSEYSVRDSDASSVVGGRFPNMQRHSSRKSVNTGASSNETPYHDNDKQKLQIETEGRDGSRESQHQKIIFQGEQQSGSVKMKRMFVDDNESTRSKMKPFVSFDEEDHGQQNNRKESSSEKSSGKRRQFIDPVGASSVQQGPLPQQLVVFDHASQLIQKESKSNENFNRRQELVGDPAIQNNALLHQQAPSEQDSNSRKNIEEPYVNSKRETDFQQNLLHHPQNSSENTHENLIGSDISSGKQQSAGLVGGIQPRKDLNDGQFSGNEHDFESPINGNKKKVFVNQGDEKYSRNTDYISEDDLDEQNVDNREKIPRGRIASRNLPGSQKFSDDTENGKFIIDGSKEYQKNGEEDFSRNFDEDSNLRPIDHNQRSLHNDSDGAQSNLETNFLHHSFKDNVQSLDESMTPEKENNKENASEFLPHRGHPDGMPVQFAMHVENSGMRIDETLVNEGKSSQGRMATPVPKPVFKPPKDGKQKIVADNLNALDEGSGSSSRTTTIKTSEHGQNDYDMMETENGGEALDEGSDEMQKRRLFNELQAMKERRMNFEKQRQDLVKKAKNTAQQINHRRGAGRDVWKRRYFNEKKKTASLTDLCEKLNHQQDSFRKKWPPSVPPVSNTVTNDKPSFISITDERPSIKSNSKIQATRTLMSIEDLKKRLNDAKLRLTGEVKMRHEAEQELKNMKQGLLAKKIQSHVAYRKMNRFRGYMNTQNAFYNQPRSNNTFHARLR